MHKSALHAKLATLRADHGRPALLALALACAELVLPLYETHHPRDNRLRRALQPQRRREDLTAAKEAKFETLSIAVARPIREAARALYAAASLSFWHPGTNDADLLDEVAHCVRKTGDAVDAALESGSAQERLDFVQQRMEGAPSFDVWLGRRLQSAEEACG